MDTLCGTKSSPDRRRIGIPPMLELAKRLDCEKTIVLGYRDELFLTEDFAPYGKVVLASEDGRHGTKGNVLDAIREQAVDGDVIYACGPIPMLRAIKEYGLSNGMEVQISMEEKWHAESEPALPVSATVPRWTDTAM